MNEQLNTSTAKAQKQVGRPPAVTEDDVRRAVERLHREGKVVTNGAVRAQVGGARKTIDRLMVELDEFDSTISTKSTTPHSVDKAWQQSLNEHSLAIRAECQQKLDKLRGLLQQTFDALLGMEANFDLADADRIAARQERDELRGMLEIEREARARYAAALGALRDKAANAARAEAVMTAKLESALSDAQALEAQAQECQREHLQTKHELECTRSEAQAATQQAEEHREELLRTEVERTIERRVKDEHLEKLYTILEYLADRDPMARAAITSFADLTAVEKRTAPTRVRQFLGVLTGRKQPPLDTPADSDNPTDPTMPF